MQRKLSIAVVAAGLVIGSTADAAFITSDTNAPSETIRTLPDGNDFATQLAADGLTSLSIATSLAVDAPGTITAQSFGKEAAFTNQFLWAGTPVFTTGPDQIEPWGSRPETVSRTVGAGVLDFSFCALTTGSCLSNAQNDSRAPLSPQNIGLFITEDRNTAWLLWDDGGAANDDNDYDDMVVRLSFAATSVPEPATLGIFGLGLLALGATRFGRKRREDSQL